MLAKPMLYSLIRCAVRDFLIVWGARSAIGSFGHLLKVCSRLIQANNVKQLQQALRDLVQTVRQALMNPRSVQFGAFVSLYFLIFKIFERILMQHQIPNPALISGVVASSALIFERSESTRWAIAQYALTRALYNYSSRYLQWSVPFASEIFFALCSGQAVYGYVVRPETIDSDYDAFLTSVTHMDPMTIALVRAKLSASANDVHDSVQEALKKDEERVRAVCERFGEKEKTKLTAAISYALEQDEGNLSCQVIHPLQTCFERIFCIFPLNLKMTFPMYTSLNLIPMLISSWSRPSTSRSMVYWIFNVVPVIAKQSMKSGLRSASFMSFYVLVFQILLCLQRQQLSKQKTRRRLEWNLRYSYWMMGFASAIASIGIEKKNKRTELALYVCFVFALILILTL